MITIASSRRLAAGVLLALALPLATVAPAAADAVLVSTTPPAGQTVDQPPSTISLTFNEPIQIVTMKVTGPTGENVGDGTATAQDTMIIQPLKPLTAAGRYTVTYRVISVDRALVGDTVEFSYVPAGTADPGATGTSNTLLIWVIVIGLALVAAIFAILIVTRPRKEPATERADPSAE